MAITASMVKELRESTGAGMMDAKKALTETSGDFEAAVDWLRTKGLAKAAKKSGRIAAEGLVAVSVDGSNGVAIEVNSETDFVSGGDYFKDFCAKLSAAASSSQPHDLTTLMASPCDDGQSVEDARIKISKFQVYLSRAWCLDYRLSSNGPAQKAQLTRDRFPAKSCRFLSDAGLLRTGGARIPASLINKFRDNKSSGYFRTVG